MKKISVLVLSGLAVFITAAGSAQEAADPATPSPASFEEEAAACRRTVRRYCAIVQKMAPSPTLDPAQQTEGLKLLAEAQKQWKEIQSRYASNPPAEYSADPAFPGRLRAFSHALEDMERALAAGDPRRSFRACGFGCGLFVKMHEANGLDYALDRLFHLRKEIKTCQAVMKTRGLDGLRPRLGGLLQKRDAVLLAPPPFPASAPEANPYSEAVAALSRALDQLALAAAAGDAKTVGKILAEGVSLVNRPYGIAL